MIRNLTKQTILSTAPFHAVRFRDRLRGLVARPFDGFDSMVFSRCSAIHTFFMSRPIDVLFLSRDNLVLRAVPSCRPWRPCVFSLRAASVIELPEGALKHTGTEPGDRLDLCAEPLSDSNKLVRLDALESCTGANACPQKETATL